MYVSTIITRHKGDILVLIGTMCWGSSYYFLKIALRHLSTFNLMALRFLVAFLITAVVFNKTMRGTSLEDVKHGMRLGAALFCANALFTFGVGLTTIGNAGFLTSCTVIFVALIHSIQTRTLPGRALVIGLLFCVCGIAILTLNEGIRIHRGDVLCIIGAFMFAVHIFAAERAGRESDSVRACVIQFGFISLFATITSFAFESPILPPNYEALIVVLTLGIVGGGIGFICQLIGQQHTSSTRTGFIFMMESLFALLFAYLAAKEALNERTLIGGALMIIGVYASRKEQESAPTVAVRD